MENKIVEEMPSWTLSRAVRMIEALMDNAKTDVERAAAHEIGNRWNAHAKLVEIARGVDAFARGELDALDLVVQARAALQSLKD